MIGQKSLIAKLNTFTIDTFPRSVLLVGEKGIGKHTVSKYISENIIKLPLLDISDKISDELLDNIYRNPNPFIYLIDLSQLTEKDQNIILKFVEEPLNNSFIIILCESKNFVLNTVLNRCVCFEFEPYTQNEILEITGANSNLDLVLKVLRTPGKILETKTDNLLAMRDVCDKIVLRLKDASYANTLTITNKINFKDEYDKFDLNIFMDMLTYSIFSQYLETNNTNIYQLYEITLNSRKKLLDKRLNKELFFNNFLTQLWKCARGIK